MWFSEELLQVRALPGDVNQYLNQKYIPLEDNQSRVKIVS
jgi:hypothetical protein